LFYGLKKFKIKKIVLRHFHENFITKKQVTLEKEVSAKEYIPSR